VWLLAGAIIFGGFAVVARPYFHHAVQEIGLPLQHEDVIRQQAAQKGLDPSLIAAVIFAETHFVPRTSSAGAVGLMQITPDTANFIAQRSGGTRFQQSDLATPQINIAYGSYYLRYLLQRFNGNEMLAIAAYNGGETNVARWVATAAAAGKKLTVSSIPFSETRHYVQRVMSAQVRYRHKYPVELGLTSGQ
jgi:soluble lytic murein transglycosylase